MKGRSSLSRIVNRTSQNEVWIAHDQDGAQALLKTWPYQGDKPNDVVRALWDREGSSPEDESRLLVLRDAGIDSEHKCFVMLLGAPGFESLRQVFDARARHDWLRDLPAHGRKQQGLWLRAEEIVKPASHPCYAMLNAVLDDNKFDRKVEHLCKRFYRPVMGRPSLAPGLYFRLLLIGY